MNKNKIISKLESFKTWFGLCRSLGLIKDKSMQQVKQGSLIQRITNYYKRVTDVRKLFGTLEPRECSQVRKKLEGRQTLLEKIQFNSLGGGEVHSLGRPKLASSLWESRRPPSECRMWVRGRDCPRAGERVHRGNEWEAGGGQTWTTASGVGGKRHGVGRCWARDNCSLWLSGHRCSKQSAQHRILLRLSRQHGANVSQCLRVIAFQAGDVHRGVFKLEAGAGSLGVLTPPDQRPPPYSGNHRSPAALHGPCSVSIA